MSETGPKLIFEPVFCKLGQVVLVCRTSYTSLMYVITHYTNRGRQEPELGLEFGFELGFELGFQVGNRVGIRTQIQIQIRVEVRVSSRCGYEAITYIFTKEM